MRKIRRCLAAALCATMFLSACGSSGGSDGTNSEQTTTAAATAATEAASAPSEEDQLADEVIIGINSDVTNFDPHNGSGAQFICQMKMMYTTLVEEDELTGDLIPAIATEWELLDPLTWEFTIRDDIKFWDGSTLTFDDIKFSFDRIAAGTRKDISYIESLEKVDDTHFLVHFNEPFITFPCELTGTGFAIVSKNSTDDNIIGCGPYQLTGYNSGDSITYTRFDDYFKGTTPTPTITMRIITEDASRVIALETREVDIIEDIPATDRDRISENPDLKLQEATMNSIEFYAMNCVNGPTADERVRQALMYATNKDELIVAAYSGRAEKAYSWLGKQMQHCIEAYPEYDIDKAAELLEEAGYGDGLDIQVICTGTHNQMIAQVLQAQWKKIGVNLDIQPLESNAFNAAIKDTNQYQIYISSSNSSNDEPLEYLEEVATAFGAGNRTQFSDPEYDELYAVITSTLDEPERGNAIERMQQIIAEKAPVVAIAYPIDGQGMKKNVGGINLNIGRETIWYNIYKTE